MTGSLVGLLSVSADTAVDWGAVRGQIVSGCVVAAFVAALAYFVTGRFTRRNEAARARHQRSLAAAEEFYAAYGEFFATWKAWAHARGRRPLSSAVVPAETRRALLERAAECEGRYESLVVRLASEVRLTADDLVALWAMRFGFKELRRAIRSGAPLNWWRSDRPDDEIRHLGHLRYLAFKELGVVVAGVMVDVDITSREDRWWRLVARLRTVPPPSPRERAAALAAITGTSSPRHPRLSVRLSDADWDRAALILGSGAGPRGRAEPAEA